MSGSLPPELQGTLFRVGPAWPWGSREAGEDALRMRVSGVQERAMTVGGESGGDGAAGALHAVEIRDGQAVWYRRQESEADAGVFWHAGSLLALPETGIPSQYSRFLEPEEFAGGLTVPIASHSHRLAADGGRVLFGVDDDAGDDGAGVRTDDGEGIFLRVGEWDSAGALRSAQSVELERATWQHDIGVTAEHVVFIESPTTRLPAGHGGGSAVPFGWIPGAEGWIGVLPRRGEGAAAATASLDPTRPVPRDARARCLRRTWWGHRPVRLLLRRARSGPARRPGGLGRRPGRLGPLRRRRDPRRAGALAD